MTHTSLSASHSDPASTLALVLPCYNPPAGWATNILESLARLQPLLPPATAVHLYLVNDGTASVTATDLELLRLRLPQFTYLNYPVNHGKGYALRTGVEQVQETICLFTDIDFPYEESSVARVYEALRTNSCDVAVGTRDEAYYVHVPRGRTLISKMLRRSTRFLLGLAVSDTQCGLKGFNRRGREVFLRGQIDRYLFDLEFIFLASRPAAKLRVNPIPVRLKPGVVFSRMSPKILVSESGSFLKILLARLT
ncbi:glycosyltransferase family 2 protein [Hymenobacter sp. BT491]|uniref:glycosyltransferase family 2 protein n=1 Tax=Hymenobacter sp. BT491 TaxID=2766779 RepID=UPI0016538E28|nr:glycosyltransferase family 2 protein [Hymenobacter sp. BT491]